MGNFSISRNSVAIGMAWHLNEFFQRNHWYLVNHETGKANEEIYFFPPLFCVFIFSYLRKLSRSREVNKHWIDNEKKIPKEKIQLLLDYLFFPLISFLFAINFFAFILNNTIVHRRIVRCQTVREDYSFVTH